MIRLRTLGALDLRDDTRGELRAVLVQPKRLALLVYLAVAGEPGAFHRRDTLLALFWPALDQEHARHALNQALHVLRRELGPGIVAARGDEELGVDATRLWCDAAAFAWSFDEGRLEEALALYRGGLLEGFFVSGAPEFERWLDGMRTSMRQRATRSASMLSERGEVEGNRVLAVTWARRAASLTPADEAVQRRLIVLLGRQGDRTGAVRVYEEFAARLAEDFDLEPSAEVRAVVAQIRARTDTRVPAPGPGPDRSDGVQLPARDRGLAATASRHVLP